MSRKYCIRAERRKSHCYFEAQTPCKSGKSNHGITCKTCLLRTGRCRSMQQSASLRLQSI